MDSPRDDRLTADLRALRPAPRPEFAAELDQRAAAGFPRRSPLGIKGVPAFLTAMRDKRPAHPKRLLLTAGGLALAAVAVATVLVVSNENEPTHDVVAQAVEHAKPKRNFDGAGSYAPSGGTAGAASSSEQGSGVQYEAEVEAAPSASSAEQLVPFSREVSPSFNSSFKPNHRDVERSAEITLGAEPDDVADDAAKVFEAVHAHDGIVMRSSTHEGKAGEAGATFELLIPSAKLGDALAAFSQIDAVRSRHEATADITAPTVSAAELLNESRARIDSLLGQLEEAETESEREAIEAELRHERRHASRLAAQLDHLHRRADFSRVYLRIATGESEESSGGGAWGIDDALGDAGHILAVAAAVAVVAHAILGPIALIAFLAWLTHRAWVRRERRRVLS
jgi:hypothetical protein